MATWAQHPPVALNPMLTAFTTWSATSGNGAPIGGAHLGIFLKTHRPAATQKALRREPSESFGEAPIFATHLIATATAFQHAASMHQTAARDTWVSDAVRHNKSQNRQ